MAPFSVPQLLVATNLRRVLYRRKYVDECLRRLATAELARLSAGQFGGITILRRVSDE